MKHKLITTIAAVLLLGCATTSKQQSIKKVTKPILPTVLYAGHVTVFEGINVLLSAPLHITSGQKASFRVANKESVSIGVDILVVHEPDGKSFCSIGYNIKKDGREVSGQYYWPVMRHTKIKLDDYVVDVNLKQRLYE